jgi:hypothetical protein
VLIGVSTVSTGRPGHETPTGVFTILQKRKEHYSNLYNNAPMPFMQRLTWDGIALHAGNLPGHPASHGCIRLPLGFAERLFGVTALGMTVIVTDSRELPRLAIEGGGERTRAQDWTAQSVWRPDLSPTGPVSILVSAADRLVIVVRNGVEIGRAPVIVRRPVAQTEVYALASADHDRDRFGWVRVPLHDEPASTVSDDERSNLVLPARFRSLLAAILTAGSTAVVTPDSIRTAGYAEPLDLLAVERKR